ncbi:MAG: ATP-binding cassette domain-containing protein, partial [Burkholderiales bacterium]
MTAQSKPPGRRILDVRQMSVSFARGNTRFHAVRSLSLHVDRGETLAIVGESGSGKSVTSLALMRLVEFAGGSIDSGELIFQRADDTTLDLRLASEDTMRRLRGAELGMIFQEPMTSLNPVFTVGAQIREAILLHQNLSHTEATSATRRILDQVRIADSAAVMGRYPHELSGGMRQRIMIAMALSCKPSILIADEPTTALDVTIQAQILLLLKELQRELDMGVIFITHDMGVVAEIADRVMVMRLGEVVEHNQTNALFALPAHPYTKMLMAAVPILGSMRGTDEPARFLVDNPESTRQETSQAPVTSSRTDQVVLGVINLVTRFDIKSGFFSRTRKRVHAVEQVSFALHEGETLSLVGESGCGKTTIGRSIV